MLNRFFYFRENESDEKREERLDKHVQWISSMRAGMSAATKQLYLNQDASRKQDERSKLSTEERDIYHLVDATRKVNERAEEAEYEHNSRILKQ